MDDERKVEALIPEHPSKFKLANVWIKSASSWGNIEKQLFDLAISKPENRYDPETKKMKTVAFVSIREINALHEKYGYDYRRAKKAADSLGSAYIRIEDREKNKYTHVNMLEKVTYDNGQFTITFTDSIVAMGYVYPKYNYTNVIQSVNILSDATCIKLYQNLRMRCFGNNVDFDGNYLWDVEVDRLKLDIGLIDPENEAFKKSDAKNGLQSDELHIIETLKKEELQKGKRGRAVPYQRFTDFKKLIDGYLEEINNDKNIDISADWKKIHTSGKKVEKVRFFIRFKEAKKLSDEDMRKAVSSMGSFLTARDAGWTLDQLKNLITAARNNVEVVKDKYRMLLNQEDGKISNRYGWLLDAIRYDYQNTDVDGTGDIVDEAVVEIQDDTLDRLWLVYQKKTRKDLITKKVRRNINAIGYDRIKKAIENYESVIEENKRNGFNRARMSGGQFFSKGYVDYLEENFSKLSYEEKGYIGRNRNSFVANEPKARDIDYAKMAEQEEMDKVLHGFD